MTKIFARKKSVEHGQAVANAIAHNIQLRLLWSRYVSGLPRTYTCSVQAQSLHEWHETSL